MENIVYVTGAGFSAIAGIPVMSNFLEKAKDLYRVNQSEYSEFKDVIDYIHSLSYIKNYYSSDLHNIEEILSIIEMTESIGGRKSIDFRKFIKRTIEFYTPKIKAQSKVSLNEMNLFGDASVYNLLGAFLLSLINTDLKVERVQREQYGLDYEVEFSTISNSKNSYQIITLNYDKLLENVIEYISSHPSIMSDKSFFYREQGGIKYHKLHGSIESEIIPPTWNKILNDQVKDAWKGAYNALSQANHIRILGYSLPESDSYIKYLFKSAVNNNNFLKSIDVICLDYDGSVEKRYKDFIIYKKLNFISCDLKEYLKFYKEYMDSIDFDNLAERGKSKSFTYGESFHRQFLKKYND